MDTPSKRGVRPILRYVSENIVGEFGDPHIQPYHIYCDLHEQSQIDSRKAIVSQIAITAEEYPWAVMEL
ncbi:hypothetical protein M422DRAFT_24935 [Sphaerobolus stellatus SS14]|nr:hypothetical protein M422DRAFT_24935 [Sphaerobolus stellatus SS14]